jgi:hypothetical protein
MHQLPLTARRAGRGPQCAPALGSLRLRLQIDRQRCGARDNKRQVGASQRTQPVRRAARAAARTRRRARRARPAGVAARANWRTRVSNAACRSDASPTTTRRRAPWCTSPSAVSCPRPSASFFPRPCPRPSSCPRPPSRGRSVSRRVAAFGFAHRVIAVCDVVWVVCVQCSSRY